MNELDQPLLEVVAERAADVGGAGQTPDQKEDDEEARRKH